jgi:hypothetical protein
MGRNDTVRDATGRHHGVPFVVSGADRGGENPEGPNRNGRRDPSVAAAAADLRSMGAGWVPRSLAGSQREGSVTSVVYVKQDQLRRPSAILL